MSDKLRAAAQAALDLLNNDDRDCAFAAGILQEPVGKFSKFSDGVWKEVTASSPGMLLYSAPPRREWVGLTQTQVKLLREGVHEESIKTGDSIDWVFYTHINEALKEKNT